MAQFQRKAKRAYDRRIKKVRQYVRGDLVLRRVTTYAKKEHQGKMKPNWEGPYGILGRVGHGAYRLESVVPKRGRGENNP